MANPITIQDIELAIDDVIKVAPGGVTLDPNKTQGQNHRNLMNLVKDFIIQQANTGGVPAAPDGVDWIARPGAPAIAGTSITETSSSIDNAGTTVTLAQQTLAVPLAAAGKKRQDAIVANYVAGTPVYERVAGNEVTTAQTSPTPTIPANRLFVRYLNITDGVVAVAPQPTHQQNTDLGTRQTTFSIQYQSQNQDSSGQTILIFEGGQGGRKAALAYYWDATNSLYDDFQICLDYIGDGSETWVTINVMPLITILQNNVSNNASDITDLFALITTAYKTGTVVDFVAKETEFGTEATPVTGNITANHTGAVVGHMAFMIHNNGVAPTFGSEFHKIAGSGDYVLGVKNYIYFDYRSSARINYSITQ